jgi:D-ribose pyranase
MINSGILNPQILSLLARIRHTNALVIADRGFPFWPRIETVDVSVIDDVPTVLQLIRAVRANHHFSEAYMAKEFLKNNFKTTHQKYQVALRTVPTKFEPHIEFKKRVPDAIGLIRTGDTTQYGNVILISG